MLHSRKPRCARCRVHTELCFCRRIPRLNLSTRVLLVIHTEETNKPTNTGWLAEATLANSEVWVRGKKDAPLDYKPLASGSHTSLLLYPNSGAAELTPEYVARIPGPVQLVVPDGTWGQGSRTAGRILREARIPTVKLARGALSRYQLRQETNAEGLATFEAIARALGVFEGEGVQRELEDIFQILVDRQLYMRGKLRREAVHGGLEA